MHSSPRRHFRRSLSTVPPVLLLTFLFGAALAHSASITSTAIGGNWDAPATWLGGVVPTASDDAQISAGATVTVVNNAAANSVTFLSSRTNITTLSVSSGVTLNMSGALTIQNAATNNVAAALSGAGVINCASLNVAGVVIPERGNLTTIVNSTVGALNIAGNLTVAGYDGGGSSQSKPAFDLSSGFVTVGGTIALTETGAVSGPAGTQTFSMATGSQSGTLTVSGSPAFSLSANVNLNLDGTDATVVYAGAGQTIVSAAYNNLTLSNPGVKTFSGAAPTIHDALSINNGAIFDMPANLAAVSLYLDRNRQTGNGKTYGGTGSGADFILSNYFSGPAKFKVTATTIATTTTLTRSGGSSTSVYGAGLTFHAAAAVVGGGSIPNGDTITFRSGSMIIGTAVTTNSAADLTLYNLATGSNQTITATFSGDATLVSSTSSGIAQTVTPKPLYVQGLSAANKLYDGSAAASLTGTATLLTAEAAGGSTADGHPYLGDDVALTSTAAATFTGTFVNTNGGVGVVVNITGNSLTGAQAANYLLASPDEANSSVMANLYLVAGTNAIATLTPGPTITTISAAGNPNYTYVLQRATNLSGNWSAISTNTANATGSITAIDTFGDLGGVVPVQAFYRLEWQP